MVAFRSFAKAPKIGQILDPQTNAKLPVFITGMMYQQVPISRRNLFPRSYILNIKEKISSEILIFMYQNARRHVPENVISYYVIYRDPQIDPKLRDVNIPND
jgi:hypothetical protein